MWQRRYKGLGGIKVANQLILGWKDYLGLYRSAQWSNKAAKKKEKAAEEGIQRERQLGRRSDFHTVKMTHLLVLQMEVEPWTQGEGSLQKLEKAGKGIGP